VTARALVIREAAPPDGPLILRFIEGLAEYERLRHACVATETGVRETLFGPDPAAWVLIAELDGQPVGFALWCRNYSTFLARPGIWLEDLFVVPEARGHGVGKALLATLARLATERGWGRVDWAVLDWNAPSIAFYRSLGAVAMDDWTTFRLEGDALGRVASAGHAVRGQAR
jgi:GNAT superfamily N-acetyltransferase